MISYRNNSTGDLMVAHCGNAACSSGNTITPVDSAGNTGSYTSIIIGADGLPVIAYRYADDGDLKVAHCGNAACSSGNTITTVDSASDVGYHTSITIGADGLPVISYYDGTNQDLKVAHCGNAACSGGNTVVVADPGGQVGRDSSITIGTDGFPRITYRDEGNALLKVANCLDANCMSTYKIFVDSYNNTGSYSSITIGPDGLGVISFRDATNGDLMVTHCDRTDCAAEKSTTIDATDDVGMYTSITIGADGLPLVSYYDVTNHDLKLVHCGNAACSSGNALTTVDSAGDVGRYNTAITIGADGLPLISYYDVTNGDLKVVHCASAFCTPYFRRR